MGGRKIDATSMIESIIGRQAPVKSNTARKSNTSSSSQYNAVNTRKTTEGISYNTSLIICLILIVDEKTICVHNCSSYKGFF